MKPSDMDCAKLANLGILIAPWPKRVMPMPKLANKKATRLSVVLSIAHKCSKS